MNTKAEQAAYFFRPIGRITTRVVICTLLEGFLPFSLINRIGELCRP